MRYFYFSKCTSNVDFQATTASTQFAGQAQRHRQYANSNGQCRSLPKNCGKPRICDVHSPTTQPSCVSVLIVPRTDGGLDSIKYIGASAVAAPAEIPNRTRPTTSNSGLDTYPLSADNPAAHNAIVAPTICAPRRPIRSATEPANIDPIIPPAASAPVVTP